MQIETTIEIAIGIKHKGRNLKHRTIQLQGRKNNGKIGKIMKLGPIFIKKQRFLPGNPGENSRI